MRLGLETRFDLVVGVLPDGPTLHADPLQPGLLLLGGSAGQRRGWGQHCCCALETSSPWVRPSRDLLHVVDEIGLSRRGLGLIPARG